MPSRTEFERRAANASSTSKCSVKGRNRKVRGLFLNVALVLSPSGEQRRDLSIGALSVPAIQRWIAAQEWSNAIEDVRGQSLIAFLRKVHQVEK